jgi:hypothetical protein
MMKSMALMFVGAVLAIRRSTGHEKVKKLNHQMSQFVEIICKKLWPRLRTESVIRVNQSDSIVVVVFENRPFEVAPVAGSDVVGCILRSWVCVALFEKP